MGEVISHPPTANNNNNTCSDQSINRNIICTATPIRNLDGALNNKTMKK